MKPLGGYLKQNSATTVCYLYKESDIIKVNCAQNNATINEV